MRKLLIALAALGVTLGAAGAAEFDPARPVARPAEGFTFDTLAPFLSFADAFGDRSKPGPHGTFGIIPGNTASPPHTHSGAYHGVVISGVLINPFGGEANPPRLGPGSYWYVPANAPHVTACVSVEPCRFYTHLDGPFDVHVTQR